MTEVSSLERIREQAAAWAVQSQDEQQSEANHQQRLQQWLDQDERHQSAYDQMLRIWSANETSGPDGAGGGTGVWVVAALSVGVSLLAASQLDWAYWQADHRTSVGEIRRIQLADGSTVTLNTDSAISVVVGDRVRQVQLHRGQALFAVSSSSDRPAFVVSTDEGQVTVLGTRFAVSDLGESTRVTVLKSAVRITTASRTRQTDLHAGQQIDFREDALGSISPASKHADDWTLNRLEFDDVPLQAVIARLAKYRPGLLQLSERVSDRNLRFSGSLPILDQPAALRLLSGVFSLRVRQATPWIVWLDEKEK